MNPTYDNQQTWANNVLKNMNEKFLLDIENLGDLLHYCSVGSAREIVLGRNILFSSVDNMNDHQEYLFFAEEFSKHFLRLLNENSSFKHNEIGKRIHHSFMMNARRDIDSSFVFCLSQVDGNHEEGKLSMWRAYGADGKGCALKFDGSKLSPQPDNQFPISTVIVKYLNKSKCSDEAQKLASYLINTISKYDIKDFETNFAGFMSLLNMKIGDICLSIKNSGFSEEREVRLIYRRGYDTDKKFMPVSKNFGGDVSVKLNVPIRPYTEYGLNDTALEDLLTGIIVGPSPNSWSITKALAQALREAKFNASDDFITRCMTPYRAPN